MPTWTGRQVRIKAGWHLAGRQGTACTEPFDDRYGIPWVAVEWDNEDDPDIYKVDSLEFVTESAGEG